MGFPDALVQYVNYYSMLMASSFSVRTPVLGQLVSGTFSADLCNTWAGNLEAAIFFA